MKKLQAKINGKWRDVNRVIYEGEFRYVSTVGDVDAIGYQSGEKLEYLEDIRVVEEAKEKLLGLTN